MPLSVQYCVLSSQTHSVPSLRMPWLATLGNVWGLLREKWLCWSWNGWTRRCGGQARIGRRKAVKRRTPRKLFKGLTCPTPTFSLLVFLFSLIFSQGFEKHMSVLCRLGEVALIIVVVGIILHFCLQPNCYILIFAPRPTLTKLLGK